MKGTHVLIIAVVVIVGIIWYTTRNRLNRSIETDILKVGTNAEYPPFSYRENGIITGLDIDIINEVARRLGKKVEITDMGFDSLIPALQLGTVHVVAAGISDTPERAKRALFTKPHVSGDPLIVVTLANNVVTSLADLTNKEVVINDGFIAETYMAQQAGPKLMRLPTVAEGFLALSSSRAYAFVTEQSSAQPYFKQYGKEAYNIFPIPDTGSSFSLAVSRYYPQLFTTVKNILAKMHRDGTIKRLIQKWGLS